jgi:hypothetical protein
LLRAGQCICWRLNQLSAGTIIRPRLPLPDKLLYDPLSTFSWQSISNTWYTCSHAIDASFVPVGFPFENMIDIVMRFSIERWSGFVRIVRLCLEDTVINGKMLFQPYLKGFCQPEDSTKNRNHIMGSHVCTQSWIWARPQIRRQVFISSFRCIFNTWLPAKGKFQIYNLLTNRNLQIPECHALCWSEHVYYIKPSSVTPLKRETCLEHLLFYVSPRQRKIAVQ